jgi:hypothetical protein
MGTVAVIVGGVILCFLSATVLSILFSAASSVAMHLGSRAAKGIGMAFAAVVASGLGLTWTALLYLVAERIVSTGSAVAWVVWLRAVMRRKSTAHFRSARIAVHCRPHLRRSLGLYCFTAKVGASAVVMAADMGSSAFEAKPEKRWLTS